MKPAQVMAARTLFFLLTTTIADAAQRCNGYEELCSRRYSNITYIAAHNSPFYQIGSLFSNQFDDVASQLNQGARVVQLQVHEKDGQIRMCHTSCAFHDAGLLVRFLEIVERWLTAHPTEVVSIILGNASNCPPDRFTEPMEASKLMRFVYTPPSVTMTLEDWPLLGKMIADNTRAVVMMDYGANFSSVPWLIDEFAVLWETPFSPTNSNFPCVPHRPPNESDDIRTHRMYMLNHNLNLNWTFQGAEILLPDIVHIDDTNAIQGPGSAGVSVSGCIADWGRPPTFLLADFVGRGDFQFSLMAVAAAANNLVWTGPTSAPGLKSYTWPVLAVTLVLVIVLGAAVWCCVRAGRKRWVIQRSGPR